MMPKAKVNNGDTVILNYVGKITESGEVFDDTSKRKQPMSVVAGDQSIIPGFSDAIIGMSAGDTKHIDIPAEKGYGKYNPEAVVELPKETFPDKVQENLKIGMVLPLILKNNPEQPFPATTKEIGEATYTFDLNHPLAGKDIEFEIEVISVTKAKKEKKEKKAKKTNTED
jgi:peptidylprolyl isomerase